MNKWGLALLLSAFSAYAEPKGQPLNITVELTEPSMVKLQKFMEGVADKSKLAYGEKRPLMLAFNTKDIPSLVDPKKDINVKTQVKMDIFPHTWIKGWSKNDPEVSSRNIFRSVVLEIFQKKERAKIYAILTPEYRAVYSDNLSYWKLSKMDFLAFRVSRDLAAKLPGNSYLSYSNALRPTIEKVLNIALLRARR